MSWYLTAIKKYATFSGRARRKEYWMFYLFNIIFLFVAQILDRILGITFKFGNVDAGYGFIYVLYALFVFIPMLAVVIRRLHDLDKSGGWFFIGFIPLVGPIWLFVLICTAGTFGTNTYGEDPKTVD